MIQLDDKITDKIGGGGGGGGGGGLVCWSQAAPPDQGFQ